MGQIKHEMVTVVVSDYAYDTPGWMPDVEAFRQSLPEEWRQLIIGPVTSVTNGYDTYAFLPDGSKEGWPESDAGERYRAAFVDLFSVGFSDASSPFNVTRICLGGDDPDEAMAQHMYPGRVFPEFSRG